MKPRLASREWRTTHKPTARSLIRDRRRQAAENRTRMAHLVARCANAEAIADQCFGRVEALRSLHQPTQCELRFVVDHGMMEHMNVDALAREIAYTVASRLRAYVHR